MTRYSFANSVPYCLGTKHSPRRSPKFKKPFVMSQSAFGRSTFLAVVALGILIVFLMPKVSFAQVEFDISAPKTSTIGTPVTIDAVFYYDGKPVTDVWMLFEVIEGPSKGVQGKVKTDQKGRASFAYTSKQPGEDVVEYGWKCPETGKRWRYDTVCVTWVRKPEEPTEPEIPVEGIQPGNTEVQGPKPGTTLETAEPIFAGGGEFRQSWTLLSLSGPILLDFTLIYGPDLESKSPTTDGRTQFPPWNGIDSFTSNSIVRMVEFEDRTVSPHRAYINVFLSGDTLVFRDDGTGDFVASGPVKYQLTKTGDHYYVMDPIRELGYIFRSRQLGWDLEKAGQVIRHINRVGEVVRVLDRNGNSLSYTYNDDNLPTRIEDGLGRSLKLTYINGPNIEERHLSAVSDGYGRTVVFNYQRLNCQGGEEEVLASFTDPMGHTTTFEYYKPSCNDCNLLQKINRPLGNSYIDQAWTQNPHGVYAVSSQKDADGNETTLDWTEDADGNLITTITHPDGTQRVFHHERERYPLDLTDETGKQFSMAYNGDWQMISVTDRMGDTTEITYHSQTGLIATITNNKGDTITYTYTAQEQTFTNPANKERVTFTFYNLTRVDYPDGTHETFAYDEHGNVIINTDRAGKTLGYQYNARGQVTKITNPTSGTVEYTYNADATLASSTDSDIGTTTFSYDRFKRLTYITPPNGLQVEEGPKKQAQDEGALGALRDLLGSPSIEESEAPPAGNVIRITYDLNDRVTSITNGRGNTTTYGYDANGNLVKAIDPFNRETQHAYDLMDRVAGRTNRRGKSTDYTYDELGHLASIIDPNGNAMEYGYDPRGWLNQITDPAGKVWQIGYDDEGLAGSFTTPLGNTTTFTRDRLGYITGIVNPLGSSITFTRDEMSRITGISDPLSRTTTYSYDSRGLLLGVTAPVIGTANFTRNDLGLLTTISDLNGADWSFAYTTIGRLQTLTDPLGNQWQYEYNQRGFLGQVIAQNGETQTLTYDEAGNLIKRAYSDGTNLEFTYDVLDRLIAAEGITLTYNEVGQVANTQNPPISFGASYDDGGRLGTVTYAGGLFTVTYGYDESDLLTKVTDSLTGAEVTFTYDDDGRLVGIGRSNGVNTQLTWDAASRLTRIQESSLANLRYTYNAADEVIQEVRTGFPGGKTINYEYDRASRLIMADYGGGNSLSYTYDSAGNLLGRTGKTPSEAVTDKADSFAYDDASQLNSPGYSYDARGRLTASIDDIYAWDGASHLVGANDVVLTYNGLGDLVTRTEAGTTTHFCYNYAIGLTPIVAERNDTTGQFLRYYVWAPDGRLLYMIDAQDGNGAYFCHFDRTGSTLALTDSGGNVTDAYTYTPYGRLLAHDGSNPQPFTFVGKWGVRQEGPSGALYHMRARYYDARAGRFLSREAIWPVPSQPKELNPYIYAMNNPLSHIDPRGTDPVVTTFTKKLIIEAGKAIGLDILLPSAGEIMDEALERTEPPDYAGDWGLLLKDTYLGAVAALSPDELLVWAGGRYYVPYIVGEYNKELAERINWAEQERLREMAQEYAQEIARREREQEELRAYFLPRGERIWRNTIGCRETEQKALGMKKVQGVWIGMYDKWIFLQPFTPGAFRMCQDTGLFWIAVDYKGEARTMKIEGVLQVEPGFTYVEK